jgi:hypothetical protein
MHGDHKSTVPYPQFYREVFSGQGRPTHPRRITLWRYTSVPHASISIVIVKPSHCSGPLANRWPKRE